MKPTATYIYPNKPNSVGGRTYVKTTDAIDFVTTTPVTIQKPGKIQEIIDSGKAPTVAPSQYIQ